MIKIKLMNDVMLEISDIFRFEPLDDITKNLIEKNLRYRYPEVPNIDIYLNDDMIINIDLLFESEQDAVWFTLKHF